MAEALLENVLGRLKTEDASSPFTLKRTIAERSLTSL